MTGVTRRSGSSLEPVAEWAPISRGRPLRPARLLWQQAVRLCGPMNVTRAVLPVMRQQRSGQIISISSSAGLAAGFDFVSAYAASKFGLEGWMESLHAEIAPFGITTTIVNPGFFRTE